VNQSINNPRLVRMVDVGIQTNYNMVFKVIACTHMKSSNDALE
jgi:hypothetical protein